MPWAQYQTISLARPLRVQTEVPLAPDIEANGVVNRIEIAENPMHVDSYSQQMCGRAR
eukprot:CAMPEP_0195107190 /NCGR_PEP_ID=MMETSP0448-20130528/81937_1 /TAXON_ID=66468 /ORGANISM="Heterocapsa triquestra, Strain CCMP 448" /LENGTH=57 /DNA_ID=CAMNT_0040143601 /DNA_START=35 /DNA_END=206 /DNA_ORIENTATION=+